MLQDYSDTGIKLVVALSQTAVPLSDELLYLSNLVAVALFLLHGDQVLAIAQSYFRALNHVPHLGQTT